MLVQALETERKRAAHTTRGGGGKTLNPKP
jgi:hypothetical protein